MLICPQQQNIFHGGFIMEQSIEIVALIGIIITAIMLLVENIIEERQEKTEEKLREAKAAHEEVKKRWEESEKIK